MRLCAVCASFSPGRPRRQNLLTGLEVGVGAGCAQKWEVGSRLWNCLEMGRSQDNGLDFLAQAETG